MRNGVLLLALAACGSSPKPEPKAPPTGTSHVKTFADERAFLEKNGHVIVLEGDRGAKIALSAEYQGRVMTSAVSDDGRSLGWINHDFIEKKKTGTQFDNYGGEDRFWLGPEGGQYGLYFPPGAKFEFDAWQTPHAMQEGAWSVVARGAKSVTFQKAMKVVNWSNTTFDVDVTRTIRVLSSGPVETSAPFVAYESENVITNAGTEPWTKEKGLLSIWILAMYAPVPDTRVVVPFDPKAAGPVVNDAYFGKVPPDRLVVKESEGVLFFKCDGKHRSKIGLGPKRARGVLGSYSAEAKLLTIVAYDPAPEGSSYVNSMWEAQREPYAGDVVNSYNDGSPGPGKPPLGGFYEIETSSPGEALAPGAKAKHTQRTYHYVGEPAQLDPIARHVLGVSLAEIASSLP